MPEVLIVILFLERPYANCSFMILADSITGTKLSNGSPIPIKTTLVIKGCSLLSKFASHSCPIISSEVKFFSKP